MTGYGNNTFQYGADGIRCQKNNIHYTLDENKILQESDGEKTITYHYGVNGVIGFRLDKDNLRADYYYCKNLFGDVVAIYDANGILVAEYEYDAWGKVTVTNKDNSAYGTLHNNVGDINPIRYRSYYYDTETDLYYLESRYYDPVTGRFINADSLEYLGDGEELNNYNLFAYCGNNPVIGYDPAGTTDWGSISLGALFLGIGLFAVGIGASVLTCGVATPAMMLLAGGTAITGGLSAVNGIAELGEAVTGYNFMRDGLFKGNNAAYNIFAGLSAGLALAGSVACGGWLIKSAPRIKAYNNIQNYKYGNMAAKHLGERPYYHSNMLKKQIIKYGEMTKEGKGVYTFRIPGTSFNAIKDKLFQGTWELTVINHLKLIGHYLLRY